MLGVRQYTLKHSWQATFNYCLLRFPQDGVARGGEVKMSRLEKIKDAPKPCLHPEHNPPTHIVLKPGTYRYTCPGCGKVIEFEVPTIIY